MRVAHRHGSVMGKATIRIRRPRACVESLGEGSEGERSIRMWCPAAWANRRPRTQTIVMTAVDSRITGLKLLWRRKLLWVAMSHRQQLF